MSQNETPQASPSPWQQAKLLNRYYRRVGMAAAGEDSCPRFVTFKAGYDPALEGPEDESGRPTLNDVSMKMRDIPNPFYEGTVAVDWSEGATLCVAEIPKGAVPEPTKFNLIGIYDQDGGLVAAAATLTDWLTPDELDRSYLSVTFPMEDEDEDGQEGGEG